MYALNINKQTNRILSVTFSKYAASNMPIVQELPKGDINDYLYINNQYIYEPLQEENNKTFEEFIITDAEQLRADIDYIAVLTGVEL